MSFSYRGFGTGAGISSVAGVAVGGTTLATLATSGFSAGQIAKVASVDDYFEYAPTSTATVDHVTVEAAVGGGRWLRLNQPGLASRLRTVWVVDPQNGAASDEATGVDGAHPLLTLAEAFRRIGQGNGQNVAITLASSMAGSGDKPINKYVPLANSGVTITGTPVVIYASTITSYTSAAVATQTPTTTDCQLVDNALPGGTWTAAGALASGRILKRTNAGVIYAHPMLDKGSNTLRTAWPSDGSANPTFPVLSAADTYQLLQLPIIRDIQCTSPPSFAFTPCTTIVTCDVQMLLPTSTFVFSNCTQSAGGVAVAGSIYNNHGWNVSGGIQFEPGAGYFRTVIQGGAFRGNVAGTRRYTIVGGGHGLSVGGPLSFEQCVIDLNGDVFGIVQESTDSKGGLYFYDAASANISVDYWSLLYLFTGVTAGSGNTAAVLSASRWSQIAYVTGNSPVGAGQTSKANPLSVGIVDHPLSDLPILLTSEQNGIFATQ